MLAKFRSATQTIYAKILIILIVASFGVWGIGSMIRSSNTDFALKVGDYKISHQRFNNEVAKTEDFYRNYYGSSISDEVFATIPFAEITSQRLIKHYLLVQEAKDLNIEIPDQEILKQVFSNPNFLTDNEFDKGKFNSFLQNNRISEAFYLNFIKENVSSNLIQGLFQTYNGNYDKLTELLANFYNQEKIVDIFKITDANLENKDFQISEAELIEYHDKNSQNFVKPETRSVQYLDFSCKNFEQFVELTEAEILNSYQENADLYSIPEYRDVKQLFFNDEETANAAQQAIASGKTITEVAEMYNIDQAVINIGTVAKGQVIGDFADAIFETETGKFSETVKGPIGFHIFLIVSASESQNKPLSEVRTEIVNSLTQQKSCVIAFEKFNQVEEQIAAGSSLEEIAYNNQLQIQSNEILGRDNGFFGTLASHYPQFSQEILNELFAETEVVSNVNKMINDQVYIIYNINDITAERVKTLDEVKGIVTNIILAEKQKTEMANLASKLHIDLLKSANISADNKRFVLEKDQVINRTSQDYTFDVLESVMQAKVGDIIPPLYQDQSNSFLLIKVKAKNEMSVSKFEMQKIAQEIGNDMNNTISNSLFSSYLAYLKSKIEVVVNVKL